MESIHARGEYETEAGARSSRDDDLDMCAESLLKLLTSTIEEESMQQRTGMGFDSLWCSTWNTGATFHSVKARCCSLESAVIFHSVQ